MKIFRWLLVVVLALLTACGGGGGDFGINVPNGGGGSPGTSGSGNKPPEAIAGADLTVSVGERAVLDGTASRDPENAPLTYQWSVYAVNGGSFTLSQAGTAQATFQAQAPGIYSFQLVVNDGTQDSQPDIVTVTVTESSLIGFYDFSGDGKDRQGLNDEFILKNASIDPEGLLFLNGVYDQDPLGPDPSPGYRAWVHLPSMNYNSFTVNLDFKAIDFDSNRTLITMSKSSRWIVVNIYQSGQIVLALNNYDLIFYDLNLPAVTTNVWHNFNLSYDGTTKTICVALDGTEDCRQLDPGFNWSPLVDPANYMVRDDLQGKYIYGSEAVDYDKQLVFTNYSSGLAFHGWVDNVRIYDGPKTP